MAYITLQQLIDEFGEDHLIQLTDRTGLDVIDVGVLNAYIAEIDNDIDGYLHRRYDTPIDPVPAALRMRIMDIVRYRLFHHQATEEVEARYKMAIRWLEDIRDNRMDLPGVPLKTSGGGIAGYAPDRVFTADTLKGF